MRLIWKENGAVPIDNTLFLYILLKINRECIFKLSKTSLIFTMAVIWWKTKRNINSL